jgi:hypothetical protein
MGKMVWALVFLIGMGFPGFLYAHENMEKTDREGRLQIGTDLGFQVETLDGTAFALAFNGDYFLDRNFSVGPLIQFVLNDDLTQIGFSLQGKYHINLAGNPNLRPHLQGGLGFVFADLDLPGGGDDSDTSFLAPIGGGVEYRIARNVSASSTLLLNFTGLSIRGAVDKNALAWYFGLRFIL